MISLHFGFIDGLCSLAARMYSLVNSLMGFDGIGGSMNFLESSLSGSVLLARFWSIGF